MIFAGWLLPSRGMEELSVAEAAAYLGISKEAAHRAVRENRLKALPDTDPVRLAREAVEEFHHLRQEALVASLARSHETPVSVAARVRRGLHSSTDTGLPRPLASKLASMPLDWRMLFNKAELAAACLKDGEGCRWCRAVEFSAVLGLRPVEFAPARAELFGAEPCETCGPVLLRPFMKVLAARVHGGAVRPSGPAPRPSEAERQAAREWARQRAETAAAKPVDDDGKALVAGALRTARTRQKDARRRSDQKRVLELAQTIRALEADASVVDGRATGAARPGKLRCGHLLASGCACPRRSSVRGRR